MDNEEQRNASKGLKHQWTETEDDALVDCLVHSARVSVTVRLLGIPNDKQLI